MKNRILRDRQLQAIFGITLIAVMGVASIAPALPQIASELVLTKAQVAFLISAFTFPGIFMAPIAGILADRLGRKTVLLPSLLLFAASGCSIFFMHDYSIMIGLRIVQGIGAAALASLNTTLIGDLYKGKLLPEAMGYNASVLSLATAIYPVVGGLLAAVAWYYPFLLPLLALPVGLFALYAIPEPQIERPTTFSKYLKDISNSVFRREVLAIFLLGTLTFIILYGAFMTYMPFLLEQRFAHSPSQIGMYISMSSVTTALLASQIGKLTWRFGSLTLLRTAFLLYVVVCLLMPGIYTSWGIIFPTMLFGAAQALNIPSLHTVLAKLAPDNNRGIFMSINGMVIRLGQTLGPLIIGIGYSLNDLKGAYYLAAGFALTGFLIAVILIRKDRL